MLSRLRGRLAAVHPQLPIYLAAIALAGAAGGMWDTSFSNFLNDTFHIGAEVRGMVEFPRELPGLLTALSAGLLFFLPESRMGAVAYSLAALGMAGVGTIGRSWALMMGSMIVWSTGTHLAMPVTSSLTMSLATRERRGRRMGQVGAIARIGTIAGCIVVWILGRRGGVHYEAIYLTGACVFLGAAVLISRLRGVGIQKARPRMVTHPRYWLYYLLEMLMGARKQIFLTFGPWVLIKIFHEPPATFAKLWMCSAAISMFTAPALGRLIDHFGERTVLVVDSVVIFAICISYGFAETFLGHHPLTIWVLYASYIADQVSFDASMARATYISKIVVKPEHLAPTLSLGVSINHAVSMSVPTAGGMLWERQGYQWVFFCGAILATVYMGFAGLIRTHLPPAPGMEEEAEATAMAEDQSEGL